MQLLKNPPKTAVSRFKERGEEEEGEERTESGSAKVWATGQWQTAITATGGHRPGQVSGAHTEADRRNHH